MGMSLDLFDCLMFFCEHVCLSICSDTGVKNFKRTYHCSCTDVFLMTSTYLFQENIALSSYMMT